MLANSRIADQILLVVFMVATYSIGTRSIEANETPANPETSFKLTTGGLVNPIKDERVGPITAIELQANLSVNGDGTGTIRFCRSQFKFNDFGDSLEQEDSRYQVEDVVLRSVTEQEINKFEVFPGNPASRVSGSRVFEVVCPEGTIAKKICLVIGELEGTHRLLVYENGAQQKQLVRRLKLTGTAIGKSVKSRPLRSPIRLSTLSSLHANAGSLHTLSFAGSLDFPVYIRPDPNHLSFDAFGNVTMSTAMGFEQTKAIAKPLSIEDPTGAERTVYELISKTGSEGHKYFLVLSPNEAGDHRVIIKEQGVVLDVLSLRNDDYWGQVSLEPMLLECSPAERQAIDDLRDLIGYHFRFIVEDGCIKELDVDFNVQAEKIDTTLGKLIHLRSLSFTGIELGSDGLRSLPLLTELENLRFTRALIGEAGLACLAHHPSIQVLSFRGCKGISDREIEPVSTLPKLTHLICYREDTLLHDNEDAKVITDEGLKYFAERSELKYLNLMGQNISDVGLQYIWKLNRLESLMLSGEGITDAGLKHLEKMERLSDLQLGFTSVTPEGKERLERKFRNLH